MIYITGDTHGAWDGRKQFIKALTEEDILIVLGDLGWSWDKWHIEHFETKCQVLSILGNHENYTLIEQMPVIEKYGGKVRQMKDNVFYLLNGEMYEIEGQKFFVFGGALSIDKHWRTPYKSWWPQEQPTMGEYYHALETLEKHDWKFDYLLTHTAETDLVQIVLGRNDTVEDGTERMILELKQQIKDHNGFFKGHFFGHLHEFWKSIRDNYFWYCLYTEIYDLQTGDVRFFPTNWC